jgi:hypothetical protein
VQDSIKHHVDEYNKRFADLQLIVNALDWARKQNLDLEWLDSYDEHRSQGYSIPEAIEHANREWDL